MSRARHLRLLAAVCTAGVMMLTVATGVAQGVKPQGGCPDSFTQITVRDAFDAQVDFNNDNQICTKPIPANGGSENVIDNTSNH